MTPQSSATTAGLQHAYAHCERLAKAHYENFTVVSWLLPKALRPSMYALYAFCRHTDDLGDEATGDRVALLHEWEADFNRCFSGEPIDPILVALQDTIRRHGIPADPFLDLVEANRMDQRIARYQSYPDLLHYCAHSANPVGRMVLHVFGYNDPERQRLSDATCTALQLTNHWQDVGRDIGQGRVYLPLEDMERFGYTPQMLERRECNDAFRGLMAFQVQRTRHLFQQGSPLADSISGELRVDLRLFTAGGLAVLEAIEARNYDTLHGRPTLSGLKKATFAASAVAALASQRLLARTHG